MPVEISSQGYLDECKGVYCSVLIQEGGEIRKGVAYLHETFVSDYIDEGIINRHGDDPSGKISDYLERHISENLEDFMHVLKYDSLLYFNKWATDEGKEELRSRLKERGIWSPQSA